MIENISAIEQSLGIEAGKLTEMITSEEKHSVNLEERVMLSKDDYEERVGNIKTGEFKRGQELLLKDLKEEHELDYEGRKDPKNFITAYREKIIKEAGVEPDKKYTTLNDKFTKLQGNYSELESGFDSYKKNEKQKTNKRKINDSMFSEIPDNVDLDKNDIVAILKSKNSFNLTEDGIEITKNGDSKPLENATTMSNLTLKEFMSTAIKPYLKAVEGGRGGDDGAGSGKAGSFEAFTKEMEGLGSQEFNMEMAKRIKEGTLKI